MDLQKGHEIDWTNGSPLTPHLIFWKSFLEEDASKESSFLWIIFKESCEVSLCALKLDMKSIKWCPTKYLYSSARVNFVFNTHCNLIHLDCYYIVTCTLHIFVAWIELLNRERRPYCFLPYRHEKIGTEIS